MKKISIILFFLATLILVASEFIIDSITAKSDSNTIIIEWRTRDESGLTKFEIERSTNKIFKKIGEVEAKGKPSDYKFIDSEAFLKSHNNNDETQVKTIYTYRLKIYKSDKSYIFSNETYVAHDVSGLRRTWGMIKEMFR